MFRKSLVAVLFILLLSPIGCKKKEQQAPPQGMQQLPGGHPPVPGGPQQQPQPGMPGAPAKGPALKVVVPDTVKGKWSGVTIVIEDKTTKKTQELNVNLNSDVNVPNSNLKLHVGDFFPDFRMTDVITSGSNQPNNPAVFVNVSEGGNEIFKGWIYSKFPAVHPFEHPKYGILLKQGVAKKG